MKLKHLQRPFEVKSINDDGSFTGYATVFGQDDFYGDSILPEAFTKTLSRKRNGSIPVLWMHNDNKPIGVHTELTVDSKGLLIAGQLVRGVQQADEAHLLMKAKAISGISMGFITIDSETNNKTGQRVIKELDLWENSLVTFPAMDAARVTDVKSVSELCRLADVEQHLRDVGGFSQKEATAIVARIKAIAGQGDPDPSLEIKAALDILRNRS